ncbi:response regulator transcription factor [bacterium]|nr:response regulator transcription factor [bacterium]
MRDDEELTKREMEVLEEIIEGATNTMIARKLFMSLSTVKSHVSSILRKLNVSTRAAAAAKGVYLLMQLKD